MNIFVLPANVQFLYIVIAFVFGCCIGSFLNVLIWRLPQGQPITGRSMCPHCKHTLTTLDLVPLFSYVASRGRCRHCGARVSPRYFIIEAITGLLFAAAAYHFWPTDVISGLTLLKVLFVIAVCMVVFVIDLEHYLILNKVVYPSMAAFLVLVTLIGVLSDRPLLIVVNILCAVGAALPFWLVWFLSKGKWMGFGDVRLVTLIGLMLGWPGIVVAIFLAFILGAVLGIILIISGRKQLSSKLPFGTFLTVATTIALFYGPQLWHWYWSLLTF